MNRTTEILVRLRRWAAAGLLALVACGGGVETGGTGPTGSAVVEGPITGFGSIVVGGVRFDDAGASVIDANGAAFARDALRLGMVVEVDSGRIGDDGSGGRSGTASRVRVAAPWLGPVTALDLAAGRIAVLGQSVRLAPATVLDNLPGGTAALRVGDIVEVSGFLDIGAVTANVVATRIERLVSAPVAYRVRGVAREVATAARTLRIGTQLFDLSATGLPAGVADGAVLRLALVPSASGAAWPVTAVAVETRRLDDRDEAELEGLVTAFESAQRFAVNGVAVDASGAQVGAGVVLGARVKVRGRAAAGGIVAASVELRSDGDVFNEGIDLRDAIRNLDTAAKTFTLRGVLVDYSAVERYEHGSEADLRNDRRVRVRGMLAPDRTRVIAMRIEFVNN